MPIFKVRLPVTALQGFSDDDKKELIATLHEYYSLPKSRRIAGHEPDGIWERNADHFLADAEDDLYNTLAIPYRNNLTTLITELGLPTDIINEVGVKLVPLQKSIVDDLINASRDKKNQLVDYIKQRGKALTAKQISWMDSILKKDIPDAYKVAESFMVRAGFIGKIRNEADRQSLTTVSAILDRVPQTIEASKHEGVVLTLRQKEKAERAGLQVEVMPLTSKEIASVEVAKNRAGSKIVDIDGRTRAGIRGLVEKAIAERWGSRQLATILFDQYGHINHDMRRIALTELAMASNDAFLAGCKAGDRVYVPKVEGSCESCKRLVEGKEFIVTDKPADDQLNVWVGKTNYGRSYKDWVPCLPVHPNCRHVYHKFSRFYQADTNGKAVLKPLNDLINEERARRGLPPDLTLK